MATLKGLEPSTSAVTGRRSNQLNYKAVYGGNNRARTCDPLLVRQMLSQLSYAPKSVVFPALHHRCGIAATRYIIHHSARFVNPFLKEISTFFQIF